MNEITINKIDIAMLTKPTAISEYRMYYGVVDVLKACDW
jgi:hypothetical protein